MQIRMPSGMQGYKRAVEEGGIRNYLAVKGPGLQAGVVDSTLVDITDVVPTIADIAGVAPDAAGGSGEGRRVIRESPSHSPPCLHLPHSLHHSHPSLFLCVCSCP